MARRLVRTALSAWHQDDLIDDALHVITELVSNAVDHARLPSIRIIVARPSNGWVRLGVVDRSRVMPELRTNSNGDQIRGRGLVLVEALSDRWGTELSVGMWVRAASIAATTTSPYVSFTRLCRVTFSLTSISSVIVRSS